MGTETFLQLALASYRRPSRMPVHKNLATAAPSFNSWRAKRGTKLQYPLYVLVTSDCVLFCLLLHPAVGKSINFKVCSACKHGDDPGAPVQPHFSNFFDMIPHPLLSKLVVALFF